MQNPFKVISRQRFSILMGITVIIMLFSSLIIILSALMRGTNPVIVGEQRMETDDSALQRVRTFGIEDYYRDSSDPEIGATYPIYQSHKTWKESEIDLYWMNPLETGIATLTEDNDERIRNSLGL